MANAGESELELDAVKQSLRVAFEEIMKEVIGDREYKNEDAVEYRTKIAEACSKRVKEVTNMKYKFSLTVMVFEKTGFNRALSTVLTKADGMVNAEHRGTFTYGLVDVVLVRL